MVSSVALLGAVGAQSWVKTTAPHTNWVSIASSGDGSNLVAAASDRSTLAPGPIFTSKDCGITWTQTEAPLLAWSSVASSADGKKIFASAQGQADEALPLWSSTNGGSTWSPQGYLTNAEVLATSASGNTVLAYGGGFLYLAASSDSGLSWTYTSLPIGMFPQGVLVSADGTRLMACAVDPSSYFLWMYTSTDAGQTWTPNAGPDNSGNFYVGFAGAADATKLVVAVNQLGVFTSPDWGRTWQVQVQAWQGWPTNIPPNEFERNIASSADASKLMLNANDSIYESTNSGVSWSKTDTPGGGSLAGSADGRKFFLLSGGTFTGSTPHRRCQLERG